MARKKKVSPSILVRTSAGEVEVLTSDIEKLQEYTLHDYRVHGRVHTIPLLCRLILKEGEIKSKENLQSIKDKVKEVGGRIVGPRED